MNAIDTAIPDNSVSLTKLEKLPDDEGRFIFANLVDGSIATTTKISCD